jgi:hypothetical protein
VKRKICCRALQKRLKKKIQRQQQQAPLVARLARGSSRSLRSQRPGTGTAARALAMQICMMLMLLLIGTGMKAQALTAAGAARRRGLVVPRVSRAGRSSRWMGAWVMASSSSMKRSRGRTRRRRRRTPCRLPVKLYRWVSCPVVEGW